MQTFNSDPGKAFIDSGLGLNETMREMIRKAGLEDAPPSYSSSVVASSQVFAGYLIRKALEEHSKALTHAADALNQSARASEKHARNLTTATWVLALATVALLIATVLVALQPGA